MLVYYYEFSYFVFLKKIPISRLFFNLKEKAFLIHFFISETIKFNPYHLN